jgi:uncharacterized protein YjiS (DUF1127 family)
MATNISHGRYEDRIRNASLKPTRTSFVLCAAGRLFDRLAQWHTRSTIARQARRELQSLSDASLKDIGVPRGEIGSLADDLANRARQCR